MPPSCPKCLCLATETRPTTTMQEDQPACRTTGPTTTCPLLCGNCRHPPKSHTEASDRPRFPNQSDRVLFTSSLPTRQSAPTLITEASKESKVSHRLPSSHPTFQRTELLPPDTPILSLATRSLCRPGSRPTVPHRCLCSCQPLRHTRHPAGNHTTQPPPTYRLTGPQAHRPTGHQPPSHLLTSEVRARTRLSRALMGTHILCLATHWSFPVGVRARMDPTTRQS